IQQVAIDMGAQREIVGHLSAGKIPALLGLENVKAGETLASVKQFVPFEAVHYVTEPVATIALEPNLNSDLPKLVGILRQITLEDAVLDLIKQGKLSEYGDKAEMAKTLRAVGWEPEEARGVWSIDEPFNMILDVTKGAQYMQEVKDMVLAGYRWGIKEGPIAY